MTADSRMRCPGKQLAEVRADDLFERHERRGSAIFTRRARPAGIWTRAKRLGVSAVPSRRSTRLMLSDESRGNGRDESTASGVSTGSTSSRKKVPSWARWAGFSSLHGMKLTPAAASAGVSSARTSS